MLFLTPHLLAAPVEGARHACPTGGLRLLHGPQLCRMLADIVGRSLAGTATCRAATSCYCLPLCLTAPPLLCRPATASAACLSATASAASACLLLHPCLPATAYPIISLTGLPSAAAAAAAAAGHRPQPHALPPARAQHVTREVCLCVDQVQ